MAVILYNIMSLLAIALMLLAMRSCNSTIKVRRHVVVFTLISILASHLALCLLDTYDKYSGWINLLFVAVLIKFFWQTSVAKRNGYKLYVSVFNVIVLVIFTLSYILLGMVIINSL